MYREVVRRQRVQLTGRDKNDPSYPNYFEAAYLSGTNEYYVQARNELLKAIGAVTTLTVQQIEGEAEEDAVSAVRPSGGRVFIVHGHNEAALESVARFVEGFSCRNDPQG